MEERYVIMHMHRDPVDDAPLFWSNSEGWGFLSEATVFSTSEVAEFKYLPQEAWGWLLLPMKED